MTLLISNLQKLLKDNGYIPVKYYISHGLCVYIEIISSKNPHNIIIYIPSSYNIALGEGGNVYKIHTINMDKIISNDNIEKYYDEVDLMPDENGNLAEKMEESYKKHISLKDINTDDSKIITSIYKQLKRLKFCVQNIKYKVGITYKKYLCVLGRDNIIDFYTVKNISGEDIKKLYIVCDLELFYDKMNGVLLEDINNIVSSLYKILGNNQYKHVTLLNRVIEEKSIFTNTLNHINARKSELEAYIQKYSKMLQEILDVENKLTIELKEYGLSTSTSGYKSIHMDSRTLTEKGKIEEKLSKSIKIRNDIIKDIQRVQKQYNNIILNTDAIVFDNVIMLDTVFSNIGLLEKY